MPLFIHLQLIALIFNARNTSLLPFIKEITTTLNFKLPTLDNKNPRENQILEEQAEDLNLFMDILNTWSASALREERANIPGFLKAQQHIWHMQTANTDINQSALELGNHHYHMVYCGLKWTTFNWFTSPKGNNTHAMQTHFVKSLLEEAELHYEVRNNLLKQVPQLYDLRNQVIDTIKSIIDLEKFAFLSQFTTPSETVEPATYVDNLVAANHWKYKYEQYGQQVDKAFETLAHTLAKPGLLGIKVVEESARGTPTYKLHPSMHNILLRTYKVNFIYLIAYVL